MDVKEFIANYIFQNTIRTTINRFRSGAIDELGQLDHLSGYYNRILLATSIQELKLGFDSRLLTSTSEVSLLSPLFSLELHELGDSMSILMLNTNLSHPTIIMNSLRAQMDHRVVINGEPIIQRFIPVMIEAGRILKTNTTLISGREYSGLSIFDMIFN